MYVMERLLDAVAAKLGMARDEVRRRNMIQPSQMPYATPIKQRDGSTMTYDSGDYPECQRRALLAGGWADFPARQEAARKQGRCLGLGLANYVEGTGRGPFESASLRVGASGRIVITTGASAQGQGTKSMLTQLAADVLGVQPLSRPPGESLPQRVVPVDIRGPAAELQHPPRQFQRYNVQRRQRADRQFLGDLVRELAPGQQPHIVVARGRSRPGPAGARLRPTLRAARVGAEQDLAPGGHQSVPSRSLRRSVLDVEAVYGK